MKKIEHASDVIIELPEYEHEKHLFNYKVKNQFFWDFVRFSVSYEIAGILSNQIDSKDFTTSNKNTFQKLNELLKALIYLPATIYCSIRFFKKVDMVIFSKDRYSLVNGKNVCTHSYSLSDTFHKDMKVLILDPHNYPTKTNNNYSVNVLGVRALHVIARIVSYFSRLSKADKDNITEVNNLLENSFDINFDLMSIVKNGFLYQLSLSKVYGILFKALGNKRLVCVDNGNFKGIFLAAKKLDIRVSDYQHSIISRLYLLYQYHPDIDKEKIKNTIPDEILTWSPFWTSETNIPANKIPIGFEYFDIGKKDSYSKDSNYEQNIYFISPVIREQKVALYNIAIKLAKELPDSKIFFKLRPEDYDQNASLFSDDFQGLNNFYFANDSEVHMYEIIQQCKFIVGINSTLFIEAISLGAYPFILQADFYKDMECLFRNNPSILFKNYEELLAKIIKFKNYNMSIRNQYFMDYDQDLVRSLIYKI